jgi:hypothetical protein
MLVVSLLSNMVLFSYMCTRMHQLMGYTWVWGSTLGVLVIVWVGLWVPIKLRPKLFDRAPTVQLNISFFFANPFPVFFNSCKMVNLDVWKWWVLSLGDNGLVPHGSTGHFFHVKYRFVMDRSILGGCAVHNDTLFVFTKSCGDNCSLQKKYVICIHTFSMWS